MTRTDKMVWVDVETGGLGEHTPLLEIAVVITDSDLNEIATFDRVLRSDADESIEVHPTAAVMHAKSRLFEDYAAATPVPWWEHEDALLGFLLQHEATGLPMAGSSVHFDRRVLSQSPLKGFEKQFHYRNIDISTLSELGKVLGLPATPRGNKAHRALADIRQSISELAFYRSHWALDELADR